MNIFILMDLTNANEDQGMPLGVFSTLEDARSAYAGLKKDKYWRVQDYAILEMEVGKVYISGADIWHQPL